MASSFLMRFLDHTQRRSTVGRTPLDEWSARRRDLYLTTHNTHNRQTFTPPAGFEPTITAGERPQTYALDRTATGTGILISYVTVKIVIVIIIFNQKPQNLCKIFGTTLVSDSTVDSTGTTVTTYICNCCLIPANFTYFAFYCYMSSQYSRTTVLLFGPGNWHLNRSTSFM